MNTPKFKPDNVYSSPENWKTIKLCVERGIPLIEALEMMGTERWEELKLEANQPADNNNNPQ